MHIYEKILWFLAGWTLIEGSLILLWPRGMIAVTRKLFSSWGGVLAGMDPWDLRKLGGIELAFGLLLGGYLLWAA